MNAVAGFRLVKLKIFLALALLVAVWVVGAYVFSDLHTKLDTPLGWAWLLGLVSLGALALGMFAASWRCPVCHRWLGFSTPGSYVGVGGPDWWQRAVCNRCGAIFVKPPPSSGDPARDREARIEAAVKKDAKYYRSRAEVDMLSAIIMIPIGIFLVVISFVLFQAPAWIILAMGAFALVAGLALMKSARRRLTSGVKEREQRLRLALERREKE